MYHEPLLVALNGRAFQGAMGVRSCTVERCQISSVSGRALSHAICSTRGRHSTVVRCTHHYPKKLFHVSCRCLTHQNYT